ncbi:MAG: polysaccharide deacetylase family protein [Rhizomicrobium sp.]|nr:polysaccharide deacetylase family protein [Rhizomicrobium sp.]
MIRALTLAAVLLSGTAMAEPKIAISFDDLPIHGVLPAGVSRTEVAEQIIDALKAGAIPPTYGLVNGVGTEREPSSTPVLEMWRASGNLLGNHTWTHPPLATTDLATYEADFLKSEPLLEKYAAGSDWHWFRYPFVDEGKDEAQRAEFRSFLAEHHYKIAHVTLAVDDWDYPEPYARCLAKRDRAALAKLELIYLQRAAEGANYSRALSAQALGHDVPYILLQHIGAFQAHMLPKLIELYKAMGFGFVSLEEATADPFYKAYADPSLPAPPRGMENILWAKGQHPPASPDNHAAELQGMCR